MTTKRKGLQTIEILNPPSIIETFSIVGPKEGEGPLNTYFDEILEDDTCGMDSYEKAESEMLLTAIKKQITITIATNIFIIHHPLQTGNAVQQNSSQQLYIPTMSPNLLHLFLDLPGRLPNSQ